MFSLFHIVFDFENWETEGFTWPMNTEVGTSLDAETILGKLLWIWLKKTTELLTVRESDTFMQGFCESNKAFG